MEGKALAASAKVCFGEGVFRGPCCRSHLNRADHPGGPVCPRGCVVGAEHPESQSPGPQRWQCHLKNRRIDTIGPGRSFTGFRGLARLCVWVYCLTACVLAFSLLGPSSFLRLSVLPPSQPSSLLVTIILFFVCIYKLFFCFVCLCFIFRFYT